MIDCVTFDLFGLIYTILCGTGAPSLLCIKLYDLDFWIQNDYEMNLFCESVLTH